jgi:hypothetical protein
MTRFLLTVLLLVSMSIVVLAQEPLPNDPLVNDDANACFEGGTLEGRCLSEIDWQAGWYLIRYESGIITYDQIPFWARYAANPPGLFCEADWDVDGPWSVYVLNGFIPAGTTWFWGYGCENVSEYQSSFDMAYSQAGIQEAGAICQAHGYNGAIPVSVVYGDWWGNPNLFVCGYTN